MGSSAWRRPCPPRTGAWRTTGSAIGRPSALTCTSMVSVLSPAGPGMTFHGEATFPHPSPLAWSSLQESWRVGWPREQELISVAWRGFHISLFPTCHMGRTSHPRLLPCDMRWPLVAPGPLWKVRSSEEASPSLVPCPHPTLLGSAAHGHTGTHVTAQGGGSVCPVLMLLGFGVLQIRPWVCFTCSHPEKSTTSLTSRLRQPVLQKVLPWPHSSSWRQRSRSGQGWLCPLVGLGQAMCLLGPGPAQG